ncbi:Type 1 glutamine amidotransferase-like domain-containing protein [Candidatus Saccharibacteria bacterium]|nr:Type 1 glutamine amidotransferase-like domain-containing protein [Candidatus Saccharibacteria bacterium]
MKIILGSWGLSTEPIIKTCEDLVGKDRKGINIAIINEAIKGESGDHRWFVEELQHLSGIIGGSMEFIDIQAHPLNYIEQRIAAADLVYCFGGNTDYLANIFIKTGFGRILPKILAEKVWVGSSAGSCVLCHKEPEEIQKAIYKEKRETEHFMDIIPIIFLPHLHGFYKFDKEEVGDASKLTDLPVYALSDEAAIIVNDDNPLKIIGKDYLIAENGTIKTQG